MKFSADTFKTYIDAATQARKAAVAERDAIKADPYLSNEGRRAKLKNLSEQTGERLRSLRRQYFEDFQTFKKELRINTVVGDPLRMAAQKSEMARIFDKLSYSISTIGDARKQADHVARMIKYAQTAGDTTTIAAIRMFAEIEGGRIQSTVKEHDSEYVERLQQYGELISNIPDPSDTASRLNLDAVFTNPLSDQ
jgi:hypothetical protein